MCDCYNKKGICENHNLCTCEKFSEIVNGACPALTRAIENGECIKEITVGFDHKNTNVCCEWANTCNLLFSHYDSEFELYYVIDGQNNQFMYNEGYILSFTTFENVSDEII